MDLSVFLSVLPSICSDFPRTITAARVILMVRRGVRRRNKIINPVFLLAAQGWRREVFYLLPHSGISVDNWEL